MAAIGREAARIAAGIDWNGAETQDFTNDADHERLTEEMKQYARDVLGDPDPIDAHFHCHPNADGSPNITLTFTRLSGTPLAPEEAAVCELTRALVFTLLEHSGPAALPAVGELIGAARMWIANTILLCAANPAWPAAIARHCAGTDGRTVEALHAETLERIASKLTPIPGTDSAAPDAD